MTGTTLQHHVQHRQRCVNLEPDLSASCTDYAVTVTVTNLSQASLGRPSPRALKPRLRYKLNHGVVGGVYYNLYTRGARPGRVVCLTC